MSTRGRKPELQVIEGGLKEKPAVPDYIPAELHDEWNNVVADLVARQILTDAMLPTVETYVMAIGNMRAAQRAIAEHGALVAGKDGIPKQNPAVSLLGKSNMMISRLAAELGLTPASRSKKKMNGDEGGRDERTADLFDV